MNEHPPVTGLVLAGASALGAYEVGVLSYLYESIIPEVLGDRPTVFCGTSAGAINATALAAHADQPLIATNLLARSWCELDLETVLRPSIRSLLAMVFDLTGAPSVVRHASWLESAGGVVGDETIASLVERIPFDALAENVASGEVSGVAITATRIADGCATVFYTSHQALAPWTAEPNMTPVPAALTARHVMASAAIPFLFPSVTIGSEAFCDGGLRQVVPLSPAIHLGAQRVLVINPLATMRHQAEASPNAASPLYLAGKALNALFADRLEADLANARRTRAILRAGEAKFGAEFREALDAQLVADGELAFQPIDTLCVEPSFSLGALAAEYVESSAFKRRANTSAGALLRRIADGEPKRMGDLLAYVLFDGGFLRELIDAGRRDARQRHAELAGWLSSPT